MSTTPIEPALHVQFREMWPFVTNDVAKAMIKFAQEAALSSTVGTVKAEDAAYDRSAAIAKKLLQVDDGYSWEIAEDIFHAITNLKDTHPIEPATNEQIAQWEAWDTHHNSHEDVERIFSALIARIRLLESAQTAPAEVGEGNGNANNNNASVSEHPDYTSPRTAGPETFFDDVWQIETTSQHIARDIREGRFPEQSQRKMRLSDSIIDAIYLDLCLGTLDRDRVRLSLSSHLSTPIQAEAREAGERALAVRALEWRPHVQHNNVIVADLFPGEYWCWELAGTGYWSWGSLSGREVVGDLEVAKSAAQADHESRIHALLKEGEADHE